MSLVFKHVGVPARSCHAHGGESSVRAIQVTYRRRTSSRRAYRTAGPDASDVRRAGSCNALRWARSRMALDQWRSWPWDGRQARAPEARSRRAGGQARACSRGRRAGADSDGRSLLTAGPGQAVWPHHSPVPTRAPAVAYWDPTGVRRATLGQDGCNGLTGKAQTYGEPGRHGPWATNVSLGADPGHVSIWGNGAVPVTAPTLSRA